MTITYVLVKKKHDKRPNSYPVSACGMELCSEILYRVIFDDDLMRTLMTPCDNIIHWKHSHLVSIEIKTVNLRETKCSFLLGKKGFKI